MKEVLAGKDGKVMVGRRVLYVARVGYWFVFGSALVTLCAAIGWLKFTDIGFSWGFTLGAAAGVSVVCLLLKRAGA